MSSIHFDTVVIGAGAAGLAATTWLSTCGGQTVLLAEQHHAAGGSSGFFHRGLPRRSHDAGATQLVGCAPGQLQHELFRMATGRPLDDLERIPFIEHVLEDERVRLTSASFLPSSDVSRRTWRKVGFESPKILLHSPGSGKWIAPAGGRWARLEEFLFQCARDAHWMWKIFDKHPQFPLQTPHDLGRSLLLAAVLSPREMVRALNLLGTTVAQQATSFGLSPETAPWNLIKGLLLDTTQSSPEESPYLAGAMGLAIVSHGIYRSPRGMTGVMAPWARGLQRKENVLVKYRTRADRVQTRKGGGFLLQLGNLDSGIEWQVSCQNVILAVPMSVAFALIQHDTLLMETHLAQNWRQHLCQFGQNEWQCLTLYGLVDSRPAPDIGVAREPAHAPWYLQLFPQSRTDYPHALYVSASSPFPAAGERFAILRQKEKVTHHGHYRVFTASVHLDPEQQFSRDACHALAKSLVRRLETGMGRKVLFFEVGTPQTFAHYTGRPEGRVGGFPSTLANFLFRAPPSFSTTHTNSVIALAGDSVFPGQGVIATSLSGVLAAKRVLERGDDRRFIS